ncbi:rod-binding protein [Helicobacter himalayensis]|uniref:rod-binding protein n=1 Tax=Helicobacter himalayensis TaxID=1591088 RepID=UPI003D6E2B9A
MDLTTNALNAYQNVQSKATLQNLKSAQNAQNTQGAKDIKTSLQKIQTNEDKALREQTDNFEALFLQIMLKDAIKNENPLYPKQPGSDIYHSMYIENLAQNLSGSFGYSELLYNYLREQQR